MVSQSHLILFLSLSFLFFSQVKSDLASEKSALLSLKSALGGGSKHLNKWTTNSSTPCSWVGVSCENNTVTSLRLPGAGLKGSIPTGVIGNLTHLRFLSLRFNSLTGQLPFDLSLCTELRGLYLHDNNFSGVIPSFLFGIRGLVRLNLARNNFAGIISPAISDLKRLRSLNLEVNKLSGSIPELELPNLVLFNVSHNNLRGPIPASLRSFKPSAFEGNSLCGAPLSPCP